MNYCRALFRLRGGNERRENRRASNRFVVSDSRIVLALRPKPRFPARIELRSSLIFAGTREKRRGRRKKEEERDEARQSWNEVRLERIMRTNANAVGSERTFICHAVADVHDNRDGRIVVVDGTGRKRVPPHGAHVSDFQSLPRNVLSSEARPPPLSSVPRSIRFPLARISTGPGRRPCTLPRLSATVISLPPSYILLSARNTTLSVASTFLLIIQLYSTFFNE